VDILGVCENGPSRMRFFRYRRPSVQTMLGLTRAKKRFKKQVGITAALKPFRWWTNYRRRCLRKLGYESELGRLIRLGPRTPGGCLLVLGAFFVVVPGSLVGLGSLLWFWT
jgi:hypothetical protein